MDLIRGPVPKPWKMVIYGGPGTGKSTLANTAPSPLFIDIEDALSQIDCLRTPVINKYENPSQGQYGFVETMREVTKVEGFETLVIDTADALEDLMIDQICSDSRKNSLADFGYGKGYEILNKKWAYVIEMMDYFNRHLHKNVILVAHSIIKRYEDPMGEGYDRIVLKMHPKSASLLVSRADLVCYYDHEKIVRSNDKGTTKAIGTGRRLLFCNEKPSYIAKNRYQLPDTVEPDQIFKLIQGASE